MFAGPAILYKLVCDKCEFFVVLVFENKFLFVMYFEFEKRS